MQFPGDSWPDIESLPEPSRQVVYRLLTHLLNEPVPALAGPFPPDDPMPGSYELRLPADGVSTWYVVALDDDGTEVILMQRVRRTTHEETSCGVAALAAAVPFPTPPGRLPMEPGGLSDRADLQVGLPARTLSVVFGR